MGVVHAHGGERLRSPHHGRRSYERDESSPYVAAMARSAPHALNARSVASLQRSVGNRSVARMMAGAGAGRASVQRCGPTPCDCPAEERAAKEAEMGAGGGGGGGGGHAHATEQAGPEEDDSADDGGVIPEVEDTEQYVPGSGTCSVGVSKSVCNIQSGKYEITDIANDCCTRDCTVKHETQHVKDYTAWGCCKKASKLMQGDSSVSRRAVARKYQDWSDKVRPISECRAYKGDVACAKAKAKAKNCGTRRQKASDAACCKDIDQYILDFESQRDKWCGLADGVTAPPCPLFEFSEDF